MSGAPGHRHLHQIGWRSVRKGVVMPTATQEAYCVKCRTKRPIKNAQETTMKNGRRALKGQCEVCGTNVTLMLGNK